MAITMTCINEGTVKQRHSMFMLQGTSVSLLDTIQNIPTQLRSVKKVSWLAILTEDINSLASIL